MTYITGNPSRVAADRVAGQLLELLHLPALGVLADRRRAESRPPDRQTGALRDLDDRPDVGLERARAAQFAA
ncbi:MAG: hypothetical protein R2862_11305 [Thermoanaerobaculia bacterium]